MLLSATLILCFSVMFPIFFPPSSCEIFYFFFAGLWKVRRSGTSRHANMDRCVQIINLGDSRERPRQFFKRHANNSNEMEALAILLWIQTLRTYALGLS
ncbi:hypothetical protein QBC45DRAFT_16772 [Copromyces sp. CBS 386.78]|nr:hypothetical protein QBC45DRAFT_16772 [Copromyces sp. CBS 386.78]